MEESSFRDASGNLLTARTFERLKDDGIDTTTVRVVANAMYNTPRDVSPAPMSGEYYRPLSARPRGTSPFRQRESSLYTAEVDSPLAAWGDRKSDVAASAAGNTRGSGRPGSASKTRSTVPGHGKSEIATKLKNLSRPSTAEPQPHQHRPAWSDVSGAPLPKNPAKERTESITAPERHYGTPPGAEAANNSRGGMPFKPPAIPPLKLGLPDASSPNAKKLELSGIAKPMSPMLRPSGSTPESAIQRQLPRLSRTAPAISNSLTSHRGPDRLLSIEIKAVAAAGGLTPRSPAATSARLSGRFGSPRAGIGHSQSERGAPIGRTQTAPTAGEFSNALDQEAEIPTEIAPETQGKRASTVKQPSLAQLEAKLSEVEEQVWGAPPLSSRLGRRRSSFSGSRRASNEGDAVKPPEPVRLAGTPRALKAMQMEISADEEAQGSNVIPEATPQGPAKPNWPASESRVLEQQGQVAEHFDEKAKKRVAEETREQKTTEFEQPKDSLALPANNLSLPKTRSVDTPRLGTPRRMTGSGIPGFGAQSAEAIRPASPRKLGTPRALNPSQAPQAVESASASAQQPHVLPPKRRGSGAVPADAQTADGWVKEDSILAHSSSEAAAEAEKARKEEKEAKADRVEKQTSLPVRLRLPAGIQHRKSFLSLPGPTTGPVHCTITRETRESKMYPTYKLYLDDPAELIMAARKRKKSKTSNYIISTDAQDLLKGTFGYCGKVRSNFLGTQFLLYDGGDKPGAENARPDGPERNEVGMVRYQHNVLGTRGPRKMTVVIPKLDASGRILPMPESDGSMTERLKRDECARELIVLKNKPPKWNDQLGAYCLNFSGRVTHASVKNFQLASQDDPDSNVILQFGKIGKNKFSMDFTAPMSAIQAFGVCLSAFDGKLACE